MAIVLPFPAGVTEDSLQGQMGTAFSQSLLQNFFVFKFVTGWRIGRATCLSPYERQTNDVHIDHAWGGLFSNGVWPRIPIGLASDTGTSRCLVSSVVC
jgi:hypothetical protein